jgi:hypothetical protein
MEVHVNDIPVRLLPGMRVRHALLAAGMAIPPEHPPVVRDRWGNEVGLDGELTAGEQLHVLQEHER